MQTLTKKCSTCNIGELADSKATLDIKRGQIWFGIEQVPAQICNKCHQKYFDEKVQQRLEKNSAAIMDSHPSGRIFIYQYKDVWNYRNRRRTPEY
jgi:YgiT-type zinc finger domain-containing protein